MRFFGCYLCIIIYHIQMVLQNETGVVLVSTNYNVYSEVDGFRNLRKSKPLVGLSNPPGHPPVPDRRSPNPTAPTVDRGSRVPKPDAGGLVSSSLVQNPWNSTCPKKSILANSPLIPTSFQLDLADFGDQNNQIQHIQRFLTQFGGKIIRFDEILTESWPDRARYRRFWLFFYVFRRVSASPETDATRRKTDPRNPTLLTV